jgi:hypothetical protein
MDLQKMAIDAEKMSYDMQRNEANDNFDRQKFYANL